MEVLDLPAEGFWEIFGKHSKELSETFLLDIEAASVQTAGDLAVEKLVLELAQGLPDDKLASATQRIYTNEDRLRLRKRPSHWMVTWSFLQQIFWPWAVLSSTTVLLLLTTDINIPTTPAVSSIGVLDVLAILAFGIGEYLDHRSTLAAFRRVDTMERNPLFPRYGFNRAVQFLSWVFMTYIALTFSWPFLLVAALLKCLAAYANGLYLEKRIKLTQEELSGLMAQGHLAPAAPEEPVVDWRPAAAPARRVRQVRFDYGG